MRSELSALSCVVPKVWPCLSFWPYDISLFLWLPCFWLRTLEKLIKGHILCSSLAEWFCLFIGLCSLPPLTDWVVCTTDPKLNYSIAPQFFITEKDDCVSLHYCYNNTPPFGLNNRNVLSHSSEKRKSKAELLRFITFPREFSHHFVEVFLLVES